MTLTQITKPMLAGTYDSTKAKFPYLATPKIDGIRFIMIDGVAVSRSFKPIRNAYIQKTLQQWLPNGIDGELTCGDSFQSSSSAIMSVDGRPDFHCWVFDFVNPNSGYIDPYCERIQDPVLSSLETEYAQDPIFGLTVLRPELVENEEQLRAVEEQYLDAGFEGVMVRDPNGTYKFGRSTVKEKIGRAHV